MSIDTVIVLMVMGGLALLVAGARAGAARERRQRLAQQRGLALVQDDRAPGEPKENLG